MKKKIVAISDLHGNLPMDLPEGDILCICGDIFPLNIQTQILKCDDWLNDVFIPWTIELPYEEIILLAGNHDFYFEEVTPIDIFLTFDHTKINYLQDSWVTIYGIKFYGTPWCHQFGRWAFMKDDEWLAKKFANIPSDVDFLLTHDAPYPYDKSLESCLIEFIEHEEYNDDNSGFAKFKLNTDGTISFGVQFYNGGCCLSEALGDFEKELNK